jgi:hypothetical protein
MEYVEWHKLKWLQSDLKVLSAVDVEKLKSSLIHNDFAMPFHVWKDKKVIWILDGHHRQKVMIELENDGIVIPEKLPAVFVRCSNRSEAMKLVLVYSAVYANVNSDSLLRYLQDNELDFKELIDELSLPLIDSQQFLVNFIDRPSDFLNSLVDGMRVQGSDDGDESNGEMVGSNRGIEEFGLIKVKFLCSIIEHQEVMRVLGRARIKWDMDNSFRVMAKMFAEFKYSTKKRRNKS